MKTSILIGMSLLSLCSVASWAAEPAGGSGSPVVEAVSVISGVTVYSSSALVTRQVNTPATSGVVELVVGPLPPSIVPNSLYSEGGNGIRIMSTRYRTRVVQENTVAEAQKLETQIKELVRKEQEIQREIQTNELNAGLLVKLEGFTSGSLQQLTEKGMLNADQVTNLVKYIMTTRAERTKIASELQGQMVKLQEEQAFLRREMSKLSGRPTRPSVRQSSSSTPKRPRPGR